MAQTAAHLVERVIPWVPTRQWVVSVPVPLRYWMAASQELTAQVHTIIRTTIGQYYVNKAVTRGCERAAIQPGSVTFIQRFGSAINLNLHFHMIFLEGGYVDRTAQGLRPRFVQGEPPTDADIATVVQKISHRVLRMRRRLGYLEAGLDAPIATGYDPLVEDAPELARTMAASVQQRIAFGARAGEQVRRMGAGFGAAGEAPTLTGPRCASVHGFSLHAPKHVPQLLATRQYPGASACTKAFEPVSSVPSSSRAGCPSSGPRPVRALRCAPAAGLLCPALASRWRGGGRAPGGAGRKCV